MTPLTDSIVGDNEAVERKPFFVPRPDPSPIPEPNIFDDPLVCLIVNEKWAAHIRGVMDALDQPDTWIGTDEQIEAARQQVREALVKFGQACMICCDDELALLEEIKVLNQSIVNNQLTMIENNLTVINNQETVINQNTQQTLNSQSNTYNNWVTTNQSIAIYNQQLYDGTPQSISSELGADFDSTSEDALCAAIKRYIENDISNYTANVNLAAAVSGLIGGVAAATAIAVTAGAAAPFVGAWGMILGAGTTLSVTAWNNAASSPEAKRDTACCMFDNLKGTSISQANFMSSVGDCAFDPTTSEGRIAGRINDANQSNENYLAFLRILGQEIGGDSVDCSCDCDTDEINLVAVNDCVVTKLTDTTYRLQQSNYTNYNETGTKIFKIRIRDEFYRCFHVVSLDRGQSGYWLRVCSGEIFEGVGGGGGDLLEYELKFLDDTTPYEAIDCVLTIDCPAE